jgi:hypothetical protein
VPTLLCTVLRINSDYCPKQFIVVMGKQYFSCEGRTEVLNIMQIKCMLQRLMSINNATIHDGAKDLNL